MRQAWQSQEQVRTLELPHEQFVAMKRQADSQAALGRRDQARRLYTEAAALEPASAEPYIRLGLLDVQDGRLDEAERAFRVAAQLAPDCPECYNGLAVVHQRRKNYAAAFDAFLKCLDLDTDNLVALLGLFQASCQMGTFSKIIHYLEIFLARHPDDSAVLFCLATLYARDGRLEEARPCLKKILSLEEGKVEAAVMLEEIEARLAREDGGT